MGSHWRVHIPHYQDLNDFFWNHGYPKYGAWRKEKPFTIKFCLKVASDGQWSKMVSPNIASLIDKKIRLRGLNSSEYWNLNVASSSIVEWVQKTTLKCLLFSRLLLLSLLLSWLFTINLFYDLTTCKLTASYKYWNVKFRSTPRVFIELHIAPSKEVYILTISSFKAKHHEWCGI
jgi:hypothetical protein